MEANSDNSRLTYIFVIIYVMSIDLEMLKYEKKNKCIECIICFEDIEEQPKNYKYMCNHKDNMHEECIKNLDICPICRSISKFLYESQFNDIDEYYEYIENHRNNQNISEEQSRPKCLIIKEFCFLLTLISIVFIIAFLS